MTPKERAEERIDDWWDACSLRKLIGDHERDRLIDRITYAITAAVQEEREACARICESWFDADHNYIEIVVMDDTAHSIAEAIRARGAK